MHACERLREMDERVRCMSRMNADATARYPGRAMVSKRKLSSSSKHLVSRSQYYELTLHFSA